MHTEKCQKGVVCTVQYFLHNPLFFSTYRFLSINLSIHALLEYRAQHLLKGISCHTRTIGGQRIKLDRYRETCHERKMEPKRCQYSFNWSSSRIHRDKNWESSSVPTTHPQNFIPKQTAVLNEKHIFSSRLIYYYQVVYQVHY